MIYLVYKINTPVSLQIVYIFRCFFRSRNHTWEQRPHCQLLRSVPHPRTKGRLWEQTHQSSFGPEHLTSDLGTCVCRPPQAILSVQSPPELEATFLSISSCTDSGETQSAAHLNAFIKEHRAGTASFPESWWRSRLSCLASASDTAESETSASDIRKTTKHTSPQLPSQCLAQNVDLPGQTCTATEPRLTT